MDERDREYTNGEITVIWQPSKCIHATTCYKELREVFDPLKRPWVNMRGAPTERIIEVVRKCPTAALSFRWNDEEKNKAQQESDEKIKQALEFSNKPRHTPVTIQVMRDGPLVVQGSFEIFNEKGDKLKHMVITSFCRCGGTMNPPFCDGHHRKIGFTSE
jgi:uncharacterized Fe-S cluster protein YjdI